MQKLTINNAVVPPSYAKYTWAGNEYSIFKATKLYLSMPSVAAGLQMCFTLDTSCATLPSFCYGGSTCQ